MPPDTRLTDAAHHILSTLATELTNAGIDVPERRYVHVGQIAHDFAGQRCSEAFIIAWNQGFQGQITAAGAGFPTAEIDCAMPLSASFTIALLRCVPVPTPSGAAPSEDQLDDSGTAIMIDAWTTAATIVDSTLSGVLLTPHLTGIAIGNLTAVGPGGGVGGVTVDLFVDLL